MTQDILESYLQEIYLEEGLKDAISRLISKVKPLRKGVSESDLSNYYDKVKSTPKFKLYYKKFETIRKRGKVTKVDTVDKVMMILTPFYTFAMFSGTFLGTGFKELFHWTFIGTGVVGTIAGFALFAYALSEIGPAILAKIVSKNKKRFLDIMEKVNELEEASPTGKVLRYAEVVQMVVMVLVILTAIFLAWMPAPGPIFIGLFALITTSLARTFWRSYLVIKKRELK